MKTAVVYYSLDGSTRNAAQQLAQRLHADTFEIKTTRRYPKSTFAKMLVGGGESSFGRTPQIESIEMDPSSYDLVVLALPVWAGKAAAPLNSFIKDRSFGNVRIALLVTSASGDAESCVRDLSGKLKRATTNLFTLSLKNPGKMDASELTRELNGFAEQLEHVAGGAF